MDIITRDDLRVQLQSVLDSIKAGVIFIHPTDTIYGISCDATNEESVAKIRELKERPTTPFSIWVPSLDWIHDSCVITKEAEEWLEKLPGPYTLIMKLKNKKRVASNVALEMDSIGIRLPDHWFSGVVAAFGKPVITTSVNKSGEPFMTSREDLDQHIAHSVEFMVDEGVKKGRPSKIVHVEEGAVKER